MPILFEPFARELATRVTALMPSRVLELAADTGVATRQLAQRHPEATEEIAEQLTGVLGAGMVTGTLSALTVMATPR